MDLAVRRFIAKLLYEPQGFGQDRWPPFRRKSHAVSLLAFPEDKLKLEGSSGSCEGPPADDGDGVSPITSHIFHVLVTSMELGL